MQTKISIWLNLIFLVLSAFNAVAGAYAQTEPDAMYARSILLLLSETGACATGFIISDGKIVTNYHVANVVCPFGKCKGLRIQKSSRLGSPPVEELRYEKANLTKSAAALDIAMIEVTPALRFAQPVPPKTTALPAPGTTLNAVGYPACKVLQRSTGQLTGSDPMHALTSVPGAFGSSGSPVFTEDGSLAGVVAQAGSLSDALSYYLLRKSFPLRIIRADVVSDMLSKNDADLFKSEVSILNAYYKEAVMPLQSYHRMMPSYQFLAAAEGLRSQVLLSTSLASYAPQFLWFDDYIDALPQIPKSGDRDSSAFFALEKLLTGVNIELNGPEQSLFRLVKPDELQAALSAAGRPEAHVKEIVGMVQDAQDRKFRGVQVQLILYCVLLTFILMVLAALWGASVLYVFLESRGGFFLRAFKALCTAVLIWPASFAVFLVMGRRPRETKYPAENPSAEREL